MNKNLIIKISCLVVLLFTSNHLFGSKITIYNDAANEITAIVNYSRKNKTHEMKVLPASVASWDNISQKISGVTVGSVHLPLKVKYNKKVEVNYDRKQLKEGKSTIPTTWITPDLSLRYNEVCFLTAHNAHAAHPYGYLYAQQSWKIEDQLKNGVRGLMLDTYSVHKTNLTEERKPPTTKDVDNFEIMLWHGATGRNLKMKFASVLEIIRNFLNKNKKEIITIQLENHAPNYLIDAIIERTNISNLVLQPIDWDSKQKGWPTLQWMINNNKRLVIFNSSPSNSSQLSSKYTYYQWIHTIENQYGQLDIKKAAKERSESKRRYLTKDLYTMNYFGTITSPLKYPKANEEGIRELLVYSLKNGLQGKFKNRYPNFIALDYVNKGDAIKLVNTINRQSKEMRNGIKTMFAPLVR